MHTLHLKPLSSSLTAAGWEIRLWGLHELPTVPEGSRGLLCLTIHLCKKWWELILITPLHLCLHIELIEGFAMIHQWTIYLLNTNKYFLFVIWNTMTGAVGERRGHSEVKMYLCTSCSWNTYLLVREIAWVEFAKYGTSFTNWIWDWRLEEGEQLILMSMVQKVFGREFRK